MDTYNNMNTNSREFVKWVKKEARKEHKFELGIGGADQRMMLEFWKEYRPKMYRRLRRHGIHKLFAKILEEKAFEQQVKTTRDLGGAEALEQARMDWYLMEEEETEEEEEENIFEGIPEHLIPKHYRGL